MYKLHLKSHHDSNFVDSFQRKAQHSEEVRLEGEFTVSRYDKLEHTSTIKTIVVDEGFVTCSGQKRGTLNVERYYLCSVNELIEIVDSSKD